MRNFFISLDRVTTRVASVVAQILLVLCVAAGLFQVTSRFIFNYPADWTEVLTRFMLIWMVHIGAAVALREGALVSVDVMHRSLKGHWRKRLERVITAATIGFMGMLVYYGCVISYRVRFQLVAGMDDFGMTMTWAYLALPVGALFSIIAVCAHHFDQQSHELENAV